ncbi:flagellar assembly protein FliW [Thermincola ferriacetica]
MIVETRRFGSLEIEEKDIIFIVGGMLGFEDKNKYILLDHDQETPFKWLQSAEDRELAFVVMEPFIFYPDYEFDLPEEDVRVLGLAKPEQARVFTVLVVPEDVKKITANLKAPIVINLSNKKGKQVILADDRYPVKYYLFQEKQGQGGL